MKLKRNLIYSNSRLTFLTPVHDPGAFDVVIRNIDDNGDPIVGEEATLAAGYTFSLPSLTVESDLTRLVRTLIRELKRQILPTVALTTHTDFDPSTGDALDLIEVAELPALVLSGPSTAESPFSRSDELAVPGPNAGELANRRAPYTIDLEWSLFGVSNSTVELLNLMAVTLAFFNRNKFLEMDRDPGNPSAGRVCYEMDFAPNGEPDAPGRPNESNIRQFVATFVIRGFEVEDLAGVPNDAVIAITAETGDEPVSIFIEQIGESFGVGPSPGDC